MVIIYTITPMNKHGQSIGKGHMQRFGEGENIQALWKSVKALQKMTKVPII